MGRIFEREKEKEPRKNKMKSGTVTNEKETILNLEKKMVERKNKIKDYSR